MNILSYFISVFVSVAYLFLHDNTTYRYIFKCVFYSLRDPIPQKYIIYIKNNSKYLKRSIQFSVAGFVTVEASSMLTSASAQMADLKCLNIILKLRKWLIKFY